MWIRYEAEGSIQRRRQVALLTHIGGRTLRERLLWGR